ncbi:MAG: zeta toxin family protein [Bacteroidales bacterium]|nr:zeta toxin family protein [Bacteroidales bacterium]
MATMYIIAGCNGAGKTTASYTIMPSMYDIQEYINADEIAARLSPEKPEAAAVHASRLMMERLIELLDKDIDFAIETTLAVKLLANIIRRAQANGLKVHLIYFWLRSPELAFERVLRRVASGGHMVAQETVFRRYGVSLRNLVNVYIPICDSWILVDNSDPSSEVIAEGGKGLKTKIINQFLFDKINAQAKGLS